MASEQSTVLPDTDKKTQDETTSAWHVVVLNDPVNLMDYVVMVFRKVFGYSLEKSKKHMLEVHEQGRSILWSGDKEKAEGYVHTLQSWQLNAMVSRNG